MQVYITSFSVNGRDTSLISNQSFPYHFKNIVLRFAAPEINGSTVSYQYNINNAGWQNNNNGLLELPQLKPGHYSIDFRAIDANGQASPMICNFKFTIHPPWWQTWWFISSMTIAVAGLLYYWLQKNNRNKREKAIEQLATQQKLTDLELQAVKAQINPHFVFNCLNSIKSPIHQQQYDDADKYLDNFSYLLRSTIDHSSQKMIPLEDEIKYIDNYLRLEQLRFGKKLSYKIDTIVADSKQLQIPSMLLQPYVENAIKHGIRNLAGGNGFVSIHLIQTANTLTCHIDDNGVGREAAAQINATNPNYHQSVGLSLTGKREELFGIQCTTIDKNGRRQKCRYNCCFRNSVALYMKYLRQLNQPPPKPTILNPQVTCMLIDDEPNNLKLLYALITKHFPQLQIIKSSDNPATAILQMDELEPQLIFLDVEMPGMSGFEILKKLEPVNFEVIFVTAYNHYALQAFDANATGYLTKPVAVDKFIEVTNRAIQKIQQQQQAKNLFSLLENHLQQNQQQQKIPLPSQTGMQFVPQQEIIFLESSGN